MPRRAVRRLLVTWRRYLVRQGPQHAAAITYFSILTLVPVAMLAAAGTGFTLTVLQPDKLDDLRRNVLNHLGSTETAQSLIGALVASLTEWRGLGITAAVAAGWAGTLWVGSLRIAIRDMLRADDAPPAWQQGFLRMLVRDLVVFVGLLVGVLLLFGVTVVGFAFAGFLGLFGWLVRLLVTVLVGWAILGFLFVTLPERRLPARTWSMAALIGAVIITLMHQFGGFLLAALSRNPMAVAFGGVITTMVLFNLLAVIALLAAAWAGGTKRRPLRGSGEAAAEE